jgi:GNAT superfamily N-acetyltransferase
MSRPAGHTTGRDAARHDGVGGLELTDISIRRLDQSSWADFEDRIMRIEDESYEPARRDHREFFARIVGQPRAVTLVALRDDAVLGFCFGAPLESFPEVDGTWSDPEWSRGTTLYCADVTVSGAYRGRGIGFLLKRSLLEEARQLGYRYVAGRNRVGMAAAMWRLNRRLGAYQVQWLERSYRDRLQPSDCIYYHIDLQHAEE